MIPTARAENGLATPLPTGDYFGAVSIVPYTRSSSGYICTTCSPVKAQARILFLQNSMIFNISSASSGSCSLFTQGYYFYNVSEPPKFLNKGFCVLLLLSVDPFIYCIRIEMIVYMVASPDSYFLLSL